MRRLSRRARGLPRALSRGRPDAADAAAAALRPRRLQLPAPGPLRRARLSAAGRVPAVGAGRGFHRRRVRADRTAPAHAVARRGRAAAPGRGRGLRGQPAARCRAARGVYRVTMRHGVSRLVRGSASRSASSSTTPLEARLERVRRAMGSTKYTPRFAIGPGSRAAIDMASRETPAVVKADPPRDCAASP